VDALAAARIGDEIAHGFGLAAMVAGAVVGAVAGAAVVAATAATGGLAAVVIAGAVAGGGLAGGQIMSGLSTIFNLPEPTSGVLAIGSPNVFTNHRPAIPAIIGQAGGCSGQPLNHPPLPIPIPVAEGSRTVLVNGQPAARLKAKLMCGSHIKSGSPDVLIGGDTARVGFVFDLEAWFKTGLEVLGLAALIGGGLFAAAAGAAAFGAFAGVGALGMAGMEGLGRIGDALGPGYRDLLQGVAGMGLVIASPGMARRAGGARPALAAERMSMAEAVGPGRARQWTDAGRTNAARKGYDTSHLSDDEVAALHGYTTNEGYTQLNPALRGQEPMTPQTKAFADHLNDGLDKTPSYDGTTYRGSSPPQSVLDEYRVGNSVSDAAPKSTAADPSKAFGGNLRETVHGTSGRDIAPFSNYDEAEVLFKPGTRFEVLETATHWDGSTSAVVKEVGP